MLKTNFLFTFSLLFTLSTLQAQDLQLFDGLTYEKIVGVHVYNSSKSFTATSNQQGIITLKGINPSDTLYFQHLGYALDKYTYAALAAIDFEVQLYPREEALPQFTISGKFREDLADVTNKIDIIKADAIRKQNPATAADMLQNTGSVYIQKSQMGGGSPVIRGFEANKVLIVMDGVRMNNAIYRGGHLQNVITIDNNVLERTEVVFGPGSVIYGSDALGGVMSFVSKNPALSGEAGKMVFNGSALTRYASANQEKTAHLDFSIGGKKLGALTSISFSDFDDLRIGKVRTHGEDTWGLRPTYVDRIDGQDSLVNNSNPNILRFTGYSQIDVLQKLYYQANKHLNFNLNLQYSTSSNIPRFDRLNDIKGDGLKFAEWNYGPQERLLAAFSVNNNSGNFLYDESKLALAYQQIGEDRIDRKFASNERRHREEDVKVATVNLDFVKGLGSGNHRLQYGLEGTYNDVQSTGYLEDITTNQNVLEAVATRYPDGGSEMSTYAFYLRHKWKINPKFNITDGVRYSLISLNANFIDTSFYSLPYTNLQNSFGAFTYSLGMAYKPSESTKINAGIASGFRAPNIDDATKIFDPADDVVVVPNLDLKAEYAHNFELGIQHNVGSVFQISANGYYNYLTNLIKRSKYTLNGQDSLVYDGELMGVYANINADNAYIAGVGLAASYQPITSLRFEKKFNYTKGWDISDDVPLGHIPPFFGQFSATYTHKNDKWDAAILLRYNGKKPIAQYSGYTCTINDAGEETCSTNSEDKANEALAIGTPGWYVLNVRASYYVLPSLQLTASLENMLDHHYIPFASGVSGAGRNAIVALRWGF